jgi:carbonic anhydrase
MTLFPEHLADRFRRFKFRHFAPNIDHYEELARYGQSPDVMVVSCSDSRCDPETIFSAMPGELFVVRNVANLVPPYETAGRFHGISAALEFAALNRGVAHESEAQFISKWMSMLDEAKLKVVSAHQGSERSAMLRALECEAVKTSLANLRTFPCIQELEGKGRLALHGAYFEIATGTLSVLNPVTGSFYAL